MDNCYKLGSLPISLRTVGEAPLAWDQPGFNSTPHMNPTNPSAPLDVPHIRKIVIMDTLQNGVVKVYNEVYNRSFNWGALRGLLGWPGQAVSRLSCPLYDDTPYFLCVLIIYMMSAGIYFYL